MLSNSAQANSTLHCLLSRSLASLSIYSEYLLTSLASQLQSREQHQGSKLKRHDFSSQCCKHALYCVALEVVYCCAFSSLETHKALECACAAKAFHKVALLLWAMKHTRSYSAAARRWLHNS